MDGEKKDWHSNMIQKAYESILGHDFEQAIEWFEQAVELEPDNAACHYKLSITYARSNKLSKALEHAKTAVLLEPGDEQYRLHYDILRAKDLVHEAGNRLQQGKQIDSALSLLKQAIQLDALSTEAYVLMALAYGELEDYALAADALREALKLDPQHADALRLLEEAQMKLGKYLRSSP